MFRCITEQLSRQLQPDTTVRCVWTRSVSSCWLRYFYQTYHQLSGWLVLIGESMIYIVSGAKPWYATVPFEYLPFK
jgi:hypothetical protein